MARLLLITLLLLFVTGSIFSDCDALALDKQGKNKKGGKVMSKKVLMVLASDPFRDPEYFEPRKVLEASGHKVITTSTTKTAKGAEGASVNVDLLFNEVKASDYDAIVFIGGAGSYQYHNDKKAHEMAVYAAKPGKVLGAICAAVGTIANAGILKGKKATSFSGVADMVKAGGAIYTGEGVTADGNIVTAEGPRSAKAFGQALAKALE